MDYEWDPAKAAINLAKHGIGFDAIRGFDWSLAVVIADNRGHGERRWRAFGPIGERMHAVAFTARGGRVRVISLRKANAREIRAHAAKTQA